MSATAPKNQTPSPQTPAGSTVGRKYDLLAIDLDGTLLGHNGRVSERNVRAIQDARNAGIRVVICTGRGWAECKHALEQIGQIDPVGVAGGSIVAEPKTGTTLHRFGMEAPLVHEISGALLRHNHAALLFKDSTAAGFDYFVAQGMNRSIALDPVTAWWFETMSVAVRYGELPEHDEHIDHTMRVGACGVSRVLDIVRREIERSVGQSVSVHNFPAVVAPEHASRVADGEHAGETMNILEYFSAEAHKWSAVTHIARTLNVPTNRIVAIGDEVNDLVMIQNAALGVAMGNAVSSVRNAAHRQTAACHDDGVAHAIHHILSGAW